MHQNFHFLKKLAPALAQRLIGFQLIEAFSQEKDEIIFSFINGEKEFHIKATLRNDFSCLFFPAHFDRARRNSVNLFTNIYGLTVSKLHVYENERAFSILLGTQYLLIFKLFGNRSNILLYDLEKEKTTTLFKNKLGADFALSPDILERPLDQSYDAFVAADLKIERLYPTLGKQILAQAKSLLNKFNTPEEKYEQLNAIVKSLEESNTYYLIDLEGTLTLSLLPVAEALETFNDPLEALNRFYSTYFRVGNLEREKNQVRAYINKRIQQTESYIDKSFTKLCEIEEGGKNEQWANIIMANLHQIPSHATSVTLYNFYTDQEETIRLKKDYSPQKNAEIYYRKAKNEKLEREQLQANITAREEALEEFKAYLTEIEQIETVRSLRQYLKQNALFINNTIPEDPKELFKVVEYMGYTILIGKNAKNNDLLTKKYATKNDLWLHARDVTGSHVVIKHQAGRNYPNPVIERAAELAAWNSKRKTDSLCPVIVTPKKYVRKTKGMIDGQVIIDKEKVVMVTPKS